jgi:hypothetical protein
MMLIGFRFIWGEGGGVNTRGELGPVEWTHSVARNMTHAFSRAETNVIACRSEQTASVNH